MENQGDLDRNDLSSEEELLVVEYFIIPNKEIKNLDSYLREKCFTLNEIGGEDVFLAEAQLINEKINLYKVRLDFIIDINEDRKHEEEGGESIFYHFERIYENFNDKIKSDEKFKKVVKFYDDFHLKDLLEYQKEIFEIEISLREIFTFIFLNRYPDHEDFLSEYKVNAENETELENKFFGISLFDYIRLDRNNLKGLENKDVLDIIFNSESFENFKENLNNRGILNGKHKDFILSIKEDLQKFKDVRNNVSHNRKIFENENKKDDYLQAKSNLKKKIKEFKEENFEEDRNG